MTDLPTRTQPLAGLKVVELSTSLTGAQVGQFFADFGAEVILVEPPGGHRLRSQPAFALWARAKRSIELDLEIPDDRGVFDGLVAECDVLIETFRPATRERLGLDHEVLATTNPRLVHAAITGFGSSGPLADIKGCEALVLAKVGGLSAFSGMVTRSGPAFVSVPFASSSTSQTATQGILAALYERESSGFGQLLRPARRIEPGARCRRPGPLGVDGALAHRPIPGSVHSSTSGQCRRHPEQQFHVPPPCTPHRRWPVAAVLPGPAPPVQGDDESARPRLDVRSPRMGGNPRVSRAREAAAVLGDGPLGGTEKTLAEPGDVFAADHDVWAEVFRRGTELLHHPQMIHNRMVAEFEDSRGVLMRQPGPLVRFLDGPGPGGD